ncbi:TonB-dependent receptor [Roseiterribacter gracilis]|uniref:TonB-dependent receptor n=1 Tax=Roseiterribacter gracilis TaxID=2812848 RepID=A0A8S8XFW9_9PROT|nr:TonB-dependent receptor [Rhodospirillales bacterium TMPK1]
MARTTAAQRAFACSFVSALALLGSTELAQAQIAAPTVAEEVVVTGSRIARRDALSVGPLQTLTQEDIKNSAPQSVGQLLQELPATGVSLNSNGTQGTAFGISSVNLRYLGSAEGSGNRTLVLVDGHRWVNGTGGRGFRDFVDLNTIPLGLVDRVEVLKDGASSIYGADAIAGVVNIVLKKTVEGVEAKAQAGITSENDGRELIGDLTVGHKWGRLGAMLSFEAVDMRPILTKDRDITVRAYAPVTAAPNSPRGLFLLPGVSTSNLTRIPGAAGTSAADFRVAALPADDFNTLAQGQDATGPSKRFTTFGRVTYDITDSVTAHADVLYNKRKSDQLFSPILLDVRGSNNFSIAADHPFNPFGRALTGTTLRLQRVMNEVGDRDNVQDIDTVRFAGGLDGSFNALGRSWKWDAQASYGRADASFRSVNQLDYDKLALATGPNARCAANSCVPINIFGTITPAMADYVRYNARDENGTASFDVSANLSTSLFELPAGPLGLATGVEYRRETAYDHPDLVVNATPQFVTGLSRTTSAARDATSGAYSLKEAYLELNAPLLTDLPFAKKLELSGAVRYSDYDTFGSKATTKLGLAYRPVQDVLLRGTYSEGFRAPSILELFQGRRNTDFQATDPCNGGGRNLPGCAGVPSSYNQNQFGNGLIHGIIGGNSNLKPETARTLSAGAALTPSFIPGLTLTGDWFKIKIFDAIASQTAQQILTQCANTNGPSCAFIRRAATGEVQSLLQAVANFSRIEVEGIDLSARYGFHTEIGHFTTVIDASRLLHYTNFVPQTDGSTLVDERAGKSDQPRATFPRWKGVGSVRWDRNAFEAGWKARYIGGSADIAGNAVNGGRVAAIVYQDVQLGYNFDAYNTNVTFGVDNIFNKMPPASAANNPINFDMYTYDIRGTFMYVRVQAKF